MTKFDKWNVFVDQVNEFPTVPPGFLNTTQYAKRIGLSTQALRRYIQRGCINPDDCLKVTLKNNSGRYRVIINWDVTAYSLLEQMPESKRPANFVKNDERVYRPILTTKAEREEHKNKSHKALVEKAREKKKLEQHEADNLNLPPVYTLDEAKIRLARIDIARKEAELKLANNETVLVSDVRARNKETGRLIKSALDQRENKIAAELADLTDVRAITQLLKDTRRQAIIDAMSADPFYDSDEDERLTF